MEPDLLLEPDQPDEVADALADLLAEPPRPVDPWWREGLRDALGEPADP